ncbi:MAG: DUF4272 domain-containing protein [Verrucomicrobiota bacterium]
MDNKQIRDNSIRSAKSLGVTVSLTLPLLDIGLEMRSADETVSRILAMNVVAAVAYGFDQAKAIAWLKQEALIDLLSEVEKSFVFHGIGQPDRFKVQIEGMWALAWALGVVNELKFESDCDNRFALLLPNLNQGQSSSEFRNRINLRPIEEVIAACDLAYCLHWAIRESELHGRPLPDGFKKYRISERRRALDWYLSKKQWTEVILDT